MCDLDFMLCFIGEPNGEMIGPLRKANAPMDTTSHAQRVQEGTGHSPTQGANKEVVGSAPFPELEATVGKHTPPRGTLPYKPLHGRLCNPSPLHQDRGGPRRGSRLGLQS